MTDSIPASFPLGFDPASLRKKYDAERDKRLRDDGSSQYIDLSGKFAAYAEDPYVEPGFTREPIVEESDAVVLGGGLAGLVAAVRLREAGVQNFRIIEQAGDFGGTWYWNRYPGIRCDIESYVYIPLLEEVGTIPSEKYARGHEILEHCHKLGEKFNLYEVALFQTVVTSKRWDEESGRWHIKTNRGDSIKTRHVLASSGPLNRPKFPGIPGIEHFKGPAFHTSRWDYEFTGGDSTGNLTGLKNKRVALIGTGATGIQVLPYLAQAAEHVYVLQRTPSAVDRRNNRPTDVAWFKSQPKGWQQRRMDNFVMNLSGVPQEENLVNDCWTDIAKMVADFAASENPQLKDASPEELFQLADYAKMEQIRAHIDEVVKNPATAQMLKPWYNIFCKRPLFSDEYLAVFNRPNVTLVDTQGRGVDTVTEMGLIVGERLYEVDCIVYATGFQAGVYTHESGGYELVGREGVTLGQKWANGVRSVHGTQVHGFPNFHIVGALSQAASTFNYPHVAARQGRHAANIVAKALKDNIRSIEVRPEAELRWAAEMASRARDNTAFERDCTPGYYNNEGNAKGRQSLFSSFYGGAPQEYLQHLDDWQALRPEDVTISYL